MDLERDLLNTNFDRETTNCIEEGGDDRRLL